MQGLTVNVLQGCLFVAVEQAEYLPDLKRLKNYIKANWPLLQVTAGETTIWIKGTANTLYEILQWVVDNIDNTTSKVHVRND